MRKKVWITFLVLLAVVCGGYLYRDLRLDKFVKVEKLPDVVIHDVKLDKMINDRRWRLFSPRVETKDNVLYGDDMDVTITEKDGTESHILAKKAIFSKENDNLQIINASGTMVSGQDSYAMTTGAADYNSKTDIWNFKNNVSLTNHETTVTGDTGYFNSGTGDCRVKGRGKITWEETAEE